MKIRFLFCLLIFALLASGCSIDLSQPPAETPASTFLPTANVANPPVENNGTSALFPTQIPVTWASMNLTGRLVYISAGYYRISLQVLNLVTGDITTLFNAPRNTWIFYAAVSPDNKQIIISYSPLQDQNTNMNQALYILPMDGSTPPQLLFQPPTQYDQYPQAEWSPDGKYIYFTHVNYQNRVDPGKANSHYEIFRMPYPNGQQEKIVDWAYWPRLSPDATRMLYIALDSVSVTNKLMISNADGSSAREVAVSGAWIPNIKDAPIFAPDGQFIILSAAAKPQAFQLNWLDKLMGVTFARAHGKIPSDWWSVPITGGALTPLTQIHSIGLYASLSLDKKYIASASINGIFVMKLDGSDLTVLLPDEINSGTVTWIP